MRVTATGPQHRYHQHRQRGLHARTRALVALVLVIFSVAVITLFLHSARGARGRARSARPVVSSASPRGGRGGRADEAGAAELRSWSFWLAPELGGKDDVRLKAAIQSLADTHGASVFPPHVTLGSFRASEPDASAATLELARSIGPELVLEADTVDSGAFYFQCVYLLMRRSNPLLMARESMERILEKRGLAPKAANPTYMPHLSLLYSDMDADARKLIASDLNDREFPRTPDGTVLDFRAAQLQLWQTEPDDKLMGSWQRVLTADL